MYKQQNYQGVINYQSGVKLDPRELGPELVIAGEWPSAVRPDVFDVAALKEDPLITETRWDKHTWDARFNLVATYEGSRQTSVTVGRQWNFTQQGFVPTFTESAPWGDHTIALEPAVAALADQELQTGAVSAWQALQTIIGGGMAGVPMDRGLLTDLVKVQGGVTNSVRFLHRLAALYWHALTAEGEGSVDVQLRLPAYAITHASATSLSNHVIQGIGGTQYIPWTEPGARDTTVVMGILWAAASGKLRPANGAGTRFLKYWPSMGEAVTVIAQDRPMVDLLTQTHQVKLDHKAVWFTAMRWAAKYSSVEIFEEAIRYVGALAISPSEGCVPLCSKRFDVALPPSNMGCFAVGPLVAPAIRLSLSACARPPAPAQLVEEAFLRASVYGLFMWHAKYSVVGWYYEHGLTDDTDAEEYMRRMGRHDEQVGVWNAINTNLGTYFNGDVGRLWSRTEPTEQKPWRTMGYWGQRALQWEELLNRTKKLPGDAGIYGTLFPLLAQRDTFSLDVWARAASVPSARTLSHVFYGLQAIDPGINTVLRLERGMNVMTAPVVSLNNYRGNQGDYVFRSGVGKGNVLFEPLVRSVDRDYYYFITDGKSPRFQWDWYIEKPGRNYTSAQIGFAGLSSPSLPPAVPIGGDEPSDDEYSSAVSDFSEYDSEDDPQPRGREITAIDPPPRVSVFASAAAPAIPLMPKKDAPKQAWIDYVAECAASNTPMGRLIAASGDPKTAVGRIGVRLEAMLLRGVPPNTVNAFAALREPSGADVTADVVFQGARKEVNNMDLYELLKSVRPASRSLVVKDVIKELSHVISAHPPSIRTLSALDKKLHGAMAMSLALEDNPSLTAEEYWDTLNQQRRAVLGGDALAVKGKDGRKFWPDFKFLAPAVRGRIPDEAVSRTLVTGGAPISSAFGEKVVHTLKQATENPSAAVKDIEDLIFSLIKRAWDGGEDPDLEGMGKMIGDRNVVDAIYQKMDAAREASKRGFQSTGQLGSGVPVQPSQTQEEEPSNTARLLQLREERVESRSQSGRPRVATPTTLSFKARGKLPERSSPPLRSTATPSGKQPAQTSKTTTTFQGKKMRPPSLGGGTLTTQGVRTSRTEAGGSGTQPAARKQRYVVGSAPTWAMVAAGPSTGTPNTAGQDTGPNVTPAATSQTAPPAGASVDPAPATSSEQPASSPAQPTAPTPPVEEAIATPAGPTTASGADPLASLWLAHCKWSRYFYIESLRCGF